MTVKLKSPDNQFVCVDIEFAKEHGLNEAILAGKMLRLQDHLTGATDDNGVKWVRLTLEEWCTELPFLGEMTIRRVIESLEEKCIFLSTTFTGRSKWYRLNPEFTEASEHKTTVQKEQIDYGNCAKRTDVTVQKEQLPISSPILISNSTELEQPPPKIRPDKKPKERPAVIPAYKVFTEITNYFPITNYWRNEMAAIVGELPEDLEFWRKVVIGWTGKYPSKHNVEGMLDFYKRREIPGYQNGNGASKNGHNQTYQSQIEVRDAPGSPAPGHAEYANGQGRGSGKTGKSASDALKSIARTGSRAIGPPLPVLPELANPPNRDIPAT